MWTLALGRIFRKERMKKIFVFLLILSVAFKLSAESKKYYKNKKLINTMYVNSLEGLKVRDTPSLSGKRICGLVNALPVKIIEIGNETEIDGIKDNWVKILIPAYEWKNQNPEYGWVFGGYLSEEKNQYNLNSTDDIRNLLTSKIWKKEDSSFIKWFEHDGTFVFAKLAAGGGDTGQFTVKDKNTLMIKGKFYDEYGTSKEYSNTLKIQIINENKIKIDNDYYFPYIDPLTYRFEDNEFIRNFVYGNYSDTSIYEFIFLENPYSHVYTVEEKNEIAEILIKYGVDASGTEYEKSYDAYWSSIIK